MTFFSQVKLNLGKATVLLGLGLSSIFLSTTYANSPKVLTKQEQAELMAKGMWYDERTGLIWDRCSVGQTWSGTTCTGQGRYTFDSATEQTRKYQLGGIVIGKFQLLNN